MKEQVQLHLTQQQKHQRRLNWEDCHDRRMLPLEIPHIWIHRKVEGRQCLTRKEKVLEEI